MCWPSATSVMARLIEARGPPKEASLKTTMYLPDEAACSGAAGATGLRAWSEQAASATSDNRMTERCFIGGLPGGAGKAGRPAPGGDGRPAGAAGRIPGNRAPAMAEAAFLGAPITPPGVKCKVNQRKRL